MNVQHSKFGEAYMMRILLRIFVFVTHRHDVQIQKITVGNNIEIIDNCDL